jgi:hypothetical protein
MKTKVFTLIALFFITGTISLSAAKKKNFTGKITFSISIQADNLPEQAKAMMPKTMTLYVGEDKTKTEIFTQMGMQSSIEDLEQKTKTSLIDMMGQKYVIRDSWEDVKKELEEMPEMKVEKTTETKEILGYTCTKIIAINVEDGKEYATAWVTDEMNVHENMNFSNDAFAGITEMMLEFEMDAGNGMIMTFTAIEIDDKKIKDKVFEVPEGFQETTREELQGTFGS